MGHFEKIVFTLILLPGHNLYCLFPEDKTVGKVQCPLPTMSRTSNIEVHTEPRCEKPGLRDFRPGLTHTRLYSHETWLEA